MPLQSLLDPPVLFFVLGLISVFLGSHIFVPRAVSQFLSLYLLMAIGFKGGAALSKSGMPEAFLYALVGGLFLSTLNPVLLFHILKNRVGRATAAAVGATYGSVSAVTFVAASTWLENRGFELSGYMIAVLALMEAPAIVMALILNQGAVEPNGDTKQEMGLLRMLHESLFNGSIFVLLGSLVIGWISGPKGSQALSIFTIDLFKGFLGIFLLDLGIKSGKSLKKAKLPGYLIAIGVLVPVLNALFALAWSALAKMSLPDTYLLMALAAGASYIAVPAALRMALPKADPGVYLTLALGVTFPFNIVIGLALYWELAKWVLG